ncbi:hypothetical protein SCHPADRAFT_837093 [Schizopora paradoxa]|uniref:Uncharacterized protein n=1 Tax=Schizopora paradoxa TaxID=27342 RepID=A0A0H2R6V8_9AGAM|nr:hypothetical protein SCHPADRAFT_837093 [Schizopora paradoxa]
MNNTWSLREVAAPSTLWFSDGAPVTSPRPGDGTSYRLIVDRLGFLDLTSTPFAGTLQFRAIDANGGVIVNPNPADPVMELNLKIDTSGGFVLTSTSRRPGDGYVPSVSGRLKPLPTVSASDVAFIDTMVKGGYVPYPNVSGAPGKTFEEIAALGKRLFPFTPFSFQLALCVYDWTTASFTRMVFMKIFEYTGIPPPPFPTDQSSIAAMIWASNWGSYNPQNVEFMRSFLMKPAYSLDNVRTQLNDVGSELHNFSAVQNRLLSAAMNSLPRTTLFKHAQLFSGQVDIYQLGLDRFGIGFLESPANNGPVGQELISTFADALSTYVSAGRTITTKMVWSFTDSVEDAMHYSNGILLVANVPQDSWVWDQASYITPLSNDPAKTEYTFHPGSQFRVESITNATVSGRNIVIITLQASSGGQRMEPEAPEGFESTLPLVLAENKIMELVNSYVPEKHLPHTEGVTGGRRCSCLFEDGDMHY